MTPENVALASTLVSRGYIEQGAQALARRRRRITSLLSERRLPEAGWEEANISLLVREAALMDSTNNELRGPPRAGRAPGAYCLSRRSGYSRRSSAATGPTRKVKDTSCSAGHGLSNGGVLLRCSALLTWLNR
jgi:hypothetical protein